MKIPLMPRSHFLAGLLSVLSFLLLSHISPAEASLLVNGSFESPSRPDGWWGVAATGWTSSGGSIWAGPGGSASPYTAPSPQDGRQYELVGSGNWIWQSFSVATAGNYDLTWFDNTLIGPSFLSRYNVYVMAGAFPVSQYRGMPVPPILATADIEHMQGNASAWNTRSLSMSLAPGNYFLMFSNGNSLGAEPFGGTWGAEDNYFALDNVSLDLAVVPEPSSYLAGALLLLPFALQTCRQLRGRVGLSGLKR